MSFLDIVESVKNRASYPAFETKFSEQAKALQDAFQEFLKQRGPYTAVRTIGGELQEHYEGAIKTLENVKKLSKPDPAALKSAQEMLNNTSAALHDFYSGAEVNGVKVSEELKTAYGKLGEAAEGAAKIMNGWFGKARVEGWGQALKHNLNVFDKATREGRGLQMGCRGAGALVGATMFGDALARSKSDGEARNLGLRVIEGLVGASLVAGSAFAGAAR